MLSLTQGPLPAITHPSAGHYGVTISGLGTGCPLPQLNPSIGENVHVTFNGGNCGGGSFNSTVVTSDGQDHFWTYMFVGTGGSSASPSASARSSQRMEIPAAK